MKRKIIAAALCAALMVSQTGITVFAASSSTAGSGSTDKAVESLEDTVSTGGSESDSSGSDSSKESTVYVISDANGANSKIIVDSWLKNDDEADTLNDSSTLKNIKNEKGDEKFDKGDDNSLIWKADGNDIYYQGSSDEQLPVDVDIQYELDGKSVNADELRDASGHLKIMFSYTNNTGRTETINGEKATIYQPYAMISGVFFDNDNARNVKVRNGKTVNDGTRTVAAGLALPGLGESLDIEKADLPASVTIEADVKDYDLTGTLTIGSSDALRQLNLDNVSSVSDLASQMDKLESASKKLVSGSRELADGTVTAENGAEKLKGGMNTLSSGAYTLDNGVSALQSGTRQLANGSQQLQNGADQLAGGLTTVKDSLDKANLNGNAQAMLNGLQKISYSIKGSDRSLYSAAIGIQNGAQNMSSSVNGKLVPGAKSVSEGASSLASNAEALSAGANQLSEAISSASSGSSGLSDAKGKIGSAAGSIKTAAGIIQSSETMSPEEKQQALSALNSAGGSLSSISVGSGASSSTASAAAAARKIASGASSLAAGANKLASGAGSLSSGAGSIASGADKIASTAGAMAQGASTITSSENLGAIIGGVNKLAGSAGQLTSGVDRLQQGAAQLAASMSQLTTGALTLDAGAGKLKSGTSSLASGAQKLDAGTISLANGLTALTAGANQLADGMAEFDSEGIQKLTGAVNGDLANVFARINAVKDYADSEAVYGGSLPEQKASVKFIYKSAEAKNPDKKDK